MNQETMSDMELYRLMAIFGGAFLTVMWGSFYFWVRFKKKDDAHRAKLRDRLSDFSDSQKSG